jgi:Clp amino terminal domain, pathogenicity island component
LTLVMATPDDLLARAVRLDDPAGGLAAVRELREHLVRVEAIHVENALRDGWRWSDVAGALGLSKQAAHRKYAQTMRPRLERDTGAARLAVLYARQEAQALGAGALGTEHVLLGLTRLAGTRTAGALGALGITSQAVHQVLPDLAPEAGAPFTEYCRAALQDALRDRSGLEPEHVLLALLRQEPSNAVRVVRALEVEPSSVRATLDPVAV